MESKDKMKLISLQLRRTEFNEMLAKIREKYSGGWLLALKGADDLRLNDYVVVDDPNPYLNGRLKGVIFSSFGRPKVDSIFLQ